MDLVSTLKQKILTLVFIRRNNEVLLGMKKRGFGKGKWNGFGGKVELNETISSAANRELFEECGLKAHNLKFIGLITFTFEIENYPMQVHVFTSNSFEGKMIETEEMRPEWFDLDKIPYEEMWLDDKYWYPIMFENKSFYGNFKFRGYEELLDHSIIEMSENELVMMHRNTVKYPV